VGIQRPDRQRKKLWATNYLNVISIIVGLAFRYTAVAVKTNFQNTELDF